MKRKTGRIQSPKHQARIVIDLCGWNAGQDLSELLQTYLDLDLTIDEGKCFWFAIWYNNVEMLNSLIDYYKKYQLSGNLDSDVYIKANYELGRMLRVAAGINEEGDVPRANISPSIIEIIMPYISDISENNIDADLDQYSDTYDIDLDPHYRLSHNLNDSTETIDTDLIGSDSCMESDF